MSKTPHDELLNAYFDGELAGEECAAERDAVERRLAVDGGSRALIEDLTELRDALRELPRHALPANFSQQVLRRAERAMLLDPADAVDLTSADFGCSEQLVRADEPAARTFSQNGHIDAKPAAMIAGVVTVAGNVTAAGNSGDRQSDISPVAKTLASPFFAPSSQVASRGTDTGWLAVAAALLLLGFGWMNWQQDDPGQRNDVAARDDATDVDRLADRASVMTTGAIGGVVEKNSDSGLSSQTAAVNDTENNWSDRFGIANRPLSGLGTVPSEEFAAPSASFQKQHSVDQHIAENLFAEGESGPAADTSFGRYRRGGQLAEGSEAAGLLVVCDIAAQPADAYAALEEAFTNHRIDVVPTIAQSDWGLGNAELGKTELGKAALGDDALGETELSKELSAGAGVDRPATNAPNSPEKADPTAQADAKDFFLADALQGAAAGEASEVRAYLVDATPVQLQNALLDMSTLPTATISVGRMRAEVEDGRRLHRGLDVESKQAEHGGNETSKGANFNGATDESAESLEQQSATQDGLDFDELRKSGVNKFGDKKADQPEFGDKPQHGEAEESPAKESQAGAGVDQFTDRNTKQRNESVSDPARAKDRPWVGFARPLRLSVEELADELSLHRERFRAYDTNESQPGGDRDTGLPAQQTADQSVDGRQDEGLRGKSSGPSTVVRRETEQRAQFVASPPARALFVFRVSPPAAPAKAAASAPAGPAKD